MANTRVFVNIAGRYVDPALICFAKQIGSSQVAIYVHGMTEPAAEVGTEYWQKLCAKYFKIEEVS